MERIETKGLSWSAALLVTAVIMIASVLLAKAITSSHGRGISDATLLPCSASQEIMPLGEGVVYSDGTHLHALNRSGKQIWNYMVGAGFSFDANESGVAAWNGSSIACWTARRASPCSAASWTSR